MSAILLKIKNVLGEDRENVKLEEVEIATEIILKEFIDKLESKKRAVVWNYGLGVVVFDKDIKELREEYLGDGNDKSDSAQSS